jgi:protein TonB
MLQNQLQAPSKIPKEIKQIKESAAPPAMAGVSGMEGMGGGTPGGVMGGILGGVGSGPPIVKAAPPKKLSISSGVMQGNLMQKTVPQYPAIAKAARIQGTVVLQATISKAGSIENLRVISGPPMLQQSAMDAVRSWRYKPYLLNGEPVEVETTVNVVFNLGG